MSFILPREVVAKGAPKPSNDRVTLTTMPAGAYAAIRFSSRDASEAYHAKSGILAAWIKKQGLVEAGSPLYAGYNPPWTPGFLRRNEVLIRVAKP